MTPDAAGDEHGEAGRWWDRLRAEERASRRRHVEEDGVRDQQLADVLASSEAGCDSC